MAIAQPCTVEGGGEANCCAVDGWPVILFGGGWEGINIVVRIWAHTEVRI